MSYKGRATECPIVNGMVNEGRPLERSIKGVQWNVELEVKNHFQMSPITMNLRLGCLPQHCFAIHLLSAASRWFYNIVTRFHVYLHSLGLEGV